MIESSNNFIEESLIAPEEIVFENTLRPKSFDEFVGQEQIKSNLNIVIEAAKGRGEQVEHILLYGPPGLGKTTLANIVSKSLGGNLRSTSGPAIERAGDLAALLSNLENGDILFIDEIHRLPKIVEEILYPAMEDGYVDIIIGKGPGARSVRMDLPKFTLIGATTRAGMLSAPLRDRFGLIYHLEYYSPEELALIIKRAARLMSTKIDEEAALHLAQRSRYTPRIANRLLKRARDFAQVHTHDTINKEVVRAALTLLEIDELGLDKNDRRILELILKQFNGGPVGLSTLAAASGEEQETIADVYEPFLIRAGLIIRGPKGRHLSNEGYEHLGVMPKTLL